MIVLIEEKLQDEQQPQKISTEDVIALMEEQIQDKQQPQKEISTEDAIAMV